MTSPSGWIARVQRLGSAYFGVVRAEISAALSDLQETGRSVFRAALLLTVTVALGFWTVGLLVYFLIEMLAIWLPRWGAVGAVFGLFLAATVGFALLFTGRVRRIEAPTQMLERRFQNHSAWWQRQMSAGEESAPAPRFADDGDDDWEER